MNQTTLPKVPEIKFLVHQQITHDDFVTEEFETFRELYQWAADESVINKQAREEYSDMGWDYHRKFTLMEYISDHVFRLLEENNYKVERIAK
jgi:hypothetical protein